MRLELRLTVDLACRPPPLHSSSPRRRVCQAEDSNLRSFRSLFTECRLRRSHQAQRLESCESGQKLTTPRHLAEAAHALSRSAPACAAASNSVTASGHSGPGTAPGLAERPCTRLELRLDRPSTISIPPSTCARRTWGKAAYTLREHSCPPRWLTFFS